MKSLLRLPSLLPLILIAGCFSGCMTRNPDTGEEVYDAESTEAIVAAFRGAVAQSVVEAATEEPELVEYFEHAGVVICQMRDNKEFSADVLLNRLQLAAQHKGVLDNRWVFTANNVITTVYRVAYARRHRVAMSEEEWPYHLMSVLCGGITDALATIPRAPAEDPPVIER